MTATPFRRLSPPPVPTAGTPQHPTKSLRLFVLAAMAIGMPLTALSTLVEPGGPFLLAALLLGLACPALVLTYREGGAAAARTLLRDCVRLPSRWWWLPVAGFGLPVASWAAAAPLGGAQPLTWAVVAFYVQDLLIGAFVINIWEEMAWAGFFQRRAASRWGAISGALVTSVFFTAIHVPLAFDGADRAATVVTNILFIAGVATGVRLLVARIDVWTGGSLLTLGVLHSAFNASETMLDPSYDWVRIAVTIALGIAVAALGNGDRSGSHQ